jgi:hypothetical protein
LSSGAGNFILNKDGLLPERKYDFIEIAVRKINNAFVLIYFDLFVIEPEKRMNAKAADEAK